MRSLFVILGWFMMTFAGWAQNVDHLKRTEEYIFFSGAHGKPDSLSVYSGFIWKPDGNIHNNGVILRTMAAYNIYRYKDEQISSVPIYGFIRELESMVGYQKFTQSFKLSWLLGINVRENRLLLQTTQSRENTFKKGVKGQFEGLLLNHAPWHFEWVANLSTVDQNRYARIRTGRKIGNFVLGVEGGASSFQSADSFFGGAFGLWNFKKNYYLSLSVGSSKENNKHEERYITLNLARLF